jgi:hypothetical protein
VQLFYFWSLNKYGFGLSILFESDFNRSRFADRPVPELPAPAFASTSNEQMMTKRIENPAAFHGRQNQAKPWPPVGTSSCSPAEFVRIRTGGAPSAKSTDEQEFVPTDDHERQTDADEP